MPIAIPFIMFFVSCVLQAILRQLGQISNEPLMTDESELECHQQLQKLYTSTKAAKVYLYADT